MNLNLAAQVDRRHQSLYRAFIGEVPIREADAIARKTDSEPPRNICPWCPDFTPDDPARAGASHQICERCAETLNAEIDRLEVEKGAACRP